MRLGVFGGSFDPVHLGHLVVAEAARDGLGLDAVLFVPARLPPHKPERPLAAPDHRAAMLALALAGNTRFELSRRELDAPAPSYTVDTLAALAREGGAATELVLVLGADSFLDLPTWRDPAGVRRLARLAVAPRAGSDGPESAAGDGDVLRIPSPVVTISASDVRARVREGRSIRYLVPEPVRRYIEEHRLYRDA